ncbi:hypothetical protein [Ligilactobacillus equi]|uniref:Uncharacterized protein n=1 Tax=Ligilactobacillus equi DSM 15833 = JCM 10991 TaxID=1423740 RepID=A0A0R1TUB8_9LACO|nr:hypothetical protein [Ligilactobacillus equi]KRL84430.1 hypothetical protein FC36_GL000188 [Ligilactobacillus equi DSM 15833 = JCM 10991]
MLTLAYRKKEKGKILHVEKYETLDKAEERIGSLSGTSYLIEYALFNPKMRLIKQWQSEPVKEYTKFEWGFKTKLASKICNFLSYLEWRKNKPKGITVKDINKAKEFK